MSSLLINSLHKQRRCAVVLNHSTYNLTRNSPNIESQNLKHFNIALKSLETKGPSFAVSHKPIRSNRVSHDLMCGLSRRHSSSLSKEPGKMARVTEKIKIDYPRRKVWMVLSDFGNLKWQPNTIDSVDLIGPEGVGQVRSINIKGISHPIKEKLIKMDHDNYEFEIEVDHGWVLPFGDYKCKCCVERIDNKSCTIVWIGEFEVLGMEEEIGAKMAAGIYKQMFIDLPRYMQKNNY